MIREITKSWHFEPWVETTYPNPGFWSLGPSKTIDRGLKIVMSGKPFMYIFKKDKFDLDQKINQSKEVPVCLFFKDRKKYWLYKDKLYWENDNLESSDLKLLLDEKTEKRKRKIEKLKLADTTSDNEVIREPISDEVKMYVWKRDEGKCVKCGSRENLEYDHIIPVSMGGSSTARNIELLCEECNRKKGGNLL